MERRRICSGDQYRDNFKERLGDIVTETKTFCFALALTPNPHILLCYWAVRKLGFSAAELSKKLSFSQLSVSISVKRGGRIAKAEQLDLVEDNKVIILWASPKLGCECS